MSFLNTTIDTYHYFASREELKTGGSDDVSSFEEGLSSKAGVNTTFTEGEALFHKESRDLPSEFPFLGGMKRLVVNFKIKDAHSRLCYAVFKDLKEKGYTVTDGMKFGGDFLAYPGEPSAFHSLFTVRVLESGSTINGYQILAASRVALAAKKHFVIASVSEDSIDSPERYYVSYSTLVTDLEFVPLEVRSQRPHIQARQK